MVAVCEPESGSTSAAASGMLPVVAAPAAQDILGLKRPSAVHTPRTDFVQPPPVGTVWTWRPQRVGADGADAGPNAIVEVFALKEGEYVREHCSVHVQRANMQSKHKNFADPQLAGQLNAYLEMLKNTAVTKEQVAVGKQLGRAAGTFQCCRAPC